MHVTLSWDAIYVPGFGLVTSYRTLFYQAIKRLQKRNSLTEEEARHRLEAQPTNLEQVAHANIVFSPYWSFDYTQQQIDKAWDNLQQYLNKRKGDTAKL